MRGADHQPTAEHVPAGIDKQRVTRWLAGHVRGLVPPVGFQLISGGRSNLTYRLTDAVGAVYALRRPPTGGVLATAHDMNREWRFISAMAPTAVPVAAPLAYCADADVTGAEFYVMGYVDGQVLADRDAGLALVPEARAMAGEQVVDVLVALHALDPAEAGLGDLVRRTGYVERQLRRWHAQVHTSETAEHTSPQSLALLDEVHGLLARRVPAQGNGVVHGDFRPGNMAFGPDGTVRAVFDWELATTGDPMADLGWLASTWQDPGDEVPPATPGPTSTCSALARRRSLAGTGCGRPACTGTGASTKPRAAWARSRGRSSASSPIPSVSRPGSAITTSSLSRGWACSNRCRRCGRGGSPTRCSW